MRGVEQNPETESNVESAGFRIAPEERRENGTMRLFTALLVE